MKKSVEQQQLSGEMYDDLCEELVELRQKTVLLTNQYNKSFGAPQKEREAILKQLLGGCGIDVHFEPDFRCEFGRHIFIGDHFYANFDCVILDAAKVTIGNHVLLGPRVGIYTANHAIDPWERQEGGCYAKPVTIGNRVWIGGGVSINQGVTIGDDSIIGSGSVVTKDIPAGVIAAGVPCRVIRKISPEDKTGFKGGR